MILAMPKVKQSTEEDIFLDNGLFNVKPLDQTIEDISEAITTQNSEFNMLVNQAKEIDSRCVDYTLKNATTDNIFFKDNGRFSFKPDSFDSPISNVEISDFALGQACAKLRIPKRYLDRCLKENPTLATENVNSWLDNYGKDLLLRCHDDKIRGILSSKYSVFDTPDILSGLQEVHDFNDFTVEGSFITPERFHARMVMPRNFDIPMEDDLMPGIQIDSSDVGRSILTVQFFIFKQVCTNGLVISQGGGMLFSQKHIGISRDEFINEFKNSVQNVPILINNSKEMITLAKSKELGVLTQDKMMQFVESIKKSVNIPDESAKRVMNIVKQEVYGVPTKWSLINALTQEAQQFTLEKRLEIEKYAGKLLTA